MAPAPARASKRTAAAVWPALGTTDGDEAVPPPMWGSTSGARSPEAASRSVMASAAAAPASSTASRDAVRRPMAADGERCGVVMDGLPCGSDDLDRDALDVVHGHALDVPEGLERLLGARGVRRAAREDVLALAPGVPGEREGRPRERREGLAQLRRPEGPPVVRGDLDLGDR